MFSYPLDFPPSLVVNGLSITPRDAVSRSESQFALDDQVYDWGGEMWTLQGSLPLLTREQSAAMRAFILKLKGKYGTFLYPLQDGAEPLGTWDTVGGVLVDGAGQTGHTLNVKGLTPSQIGACRAADYINLGTGAGTRLHMLVEDADSDGAGKATLSIWPAHRSSPAADAAVITQNCKGHFRLPKNYGWDIDVNRHYLMEFGAMEVF